MKPLSSWVKEFQVKIIVKYRWYGIYVVFCKAYFCVVQSCEEILRMAAVVFGNDVFGLRFLTRCGIRNTEVVVNIWNMWVGAKECFKFRNSLVRSRLCKRI